jgi:hypothetical protein
LAASRWAPESVQRSDMVHPENCKGS